MLVIRTNQNKSTSHKVEFESFALVDYGKDRLPASRDEINLILKAFPTALSVGVFLPVVVVRFPDLPPKPWPLTVAGFLVVFTTKENTIGLSMVDLGVAPKKPYMTMKPGSTSRRNYSTLQ